jgi:GTP-binding protein
MIHLEAEFYAGAEKAEHFPNTQFPEVAFSGRSNVGKSSLLNSLVNRKKLAFTSSTPGKTQMINFFLVNKKWMFADLPGFGYAAISKAKREEWVKLNFTYFEQREQLKMVCCLIDSRHDPQKHDMALIEWLENNNKKFIVILTKCDKISNQMVLSRKEQLEYLLANCKNVVEVIPYSSVTGLGKSQLQQIIKKEIIY